jgi:energy-coupling factor transport system ATP-binding protein
VYLSGKNTKELAPWEFGKYVGSVFQDPRSQFFATVTADELAFACENYGVEPREIQKRVNASASYFQLQDLLERKMLTLSGGEKQKVAAASVYSMRPQIYVLDEPSANLDAGATAALADLLRKLKEAGNTIIVAEHRLCYLMELADKILYLHDGEIQGEYTTAQLFTLTTDERARLGLRCLTACTRCKGCAKACCKEGSHAGLPCFCARNININRQKSNRRLLNDVSFSIMPGEIVALTGNNGLGKTTLARTICGLNKEASGEFLFAGKAIRAAKRYRHVWYVIQDADCQLFSDSVLQELLVGQKKTEQTVERAEETLRRLDLAEHRDRHPASLSGGEKQRLVLAVALMQNTDLIVLDEPTAGLDRTNMLRVSAAVKAAADSGKAFLIITHDDELIDVLCTRSISLRENASVSG